MSNEGGASAAHGVVTVEPVVRRVNRLAEALKQLAQDVGNAKAFKELEGHETLSAGLIQALRASEDATELAELRERLDDLDVLLGALDDEVRPLKEKFKEGMVSLARELGRKLQHIIDRVVALEGGAQAAPSAVGPQAAASVGGGPVTNSLAFLTSVTIVDESGVPPFTLEEFIQKHRAAEAQIKKLESDIIAQGGVVFNGESCASELQIKKLVQAEGAQEVFAAFGNPMTLNCHDREFEPSSDWESDTKEQGKAGWSDEERKHIVSFKQRHNHWCAQGKKVEQGKVILAFASESNWLGEGGQPGERSKMQRSATTATTAIGTCIKDRLKAGGSSV
mmetsp:Transcript_24640/g.52530  ORF Transcript_24640/g.52530 Transcript_24640/m.52530 type:complete len:336 (-) Transcript_24640:1722-2729(-)